MQLALRSVVLLLLCARAAPLAPSALRRERASRAALCRPFTRANVACFTATDEKVSDPQALAGEASGASGEDAPSAPDAPTASGEEVAASGAESEGATETSDGDVAASEADGAASPGWWSDESEAQDAPADDTMASIFQNMPEELQPTASEPEAAAAPEPEDERKFTFEDFVGSEWKVGLLWRGKDEADVTWARCEADESVTWGFGARGKWRIDEGRFLTLTREFPLGWGGKRLFSARIDPGKPVYLEGIVRGWKPWEPATVMGLWQGIRLSVDRTEYGSTPWANYEEEFAADVKEEEEEEAEKARLEAEEAEEKKAKKDASPWYVQILRAGNEAFEVMLKGDDD